MDLLSLILNPMVGVEFFTFAFTKTMCGTSITRSLTHGMVFLVCLLLSAVIVMTLLTFRTPATAGFNEITDPSITVGISLEIMSDSYSKRSTNIALVFLLEPLVQLSLI